MKRNKSGISLIVLVITIIVMIILAGSIIISLSNSGIIGKAEEAVDAANLQEVQQIATLAWADAYIDELKDGTVDVNELERRVLEALTKNNVDTNKYIINITDEGVSVQAKETSWTQNGTKITRNGQTLEVGQSITAKVGGTAIELPKKSDGTAITWKVMGVENGKLLLMSANNIANLTLYAYQGDWDTTTNSFVKFEKQLDDKVKEVVTQNITYVDEIRCPRVEDIDRVTGYVKENFENTGIGKYGDARTYTYEQAIDPDNEQKIFWHIDGRKIETENDEPITTVNTYYDYSATTYLTSETDPNSYALKLFFERPVTSGGVTTYGLDTYWIASSYLYNRTHRAYFGLMVADQYFVRGKNLWITDRGTYTDAMDRGIRAVIALNSNVEVE